MASPFDGAMSAGGGDEDAQGKPERSEDSGPGCAVGGVKVVSDEDEEAREREKHRHDHHPSPTKARQRLRKSRSRCEVARVAKRPAAQ